MSRTPIAEHYRAQAARYRRLADEAADPVAAAKLRSVAAFYEALDPTEADEAKSAD